MNKFIGLTLVLLSFVALSQFTYGQVDSREKSPLSMRIKAETHRGCLNRDVLVVEGILTNDSAETVLIDLKAVTYRMSFSIIRKVNGKIGSDNRTTISHPLGTDKAISILAVKPKEIYSFEHRIDLKDDFFATEGEYTVRLAYGQFSEVVFDGAPVWRGVAESNQIRFRKGSCD